MDNTAKIILRLLLFTVAVAVFIEFPQKVLFVAKEAFIHEWSYVLVFFLIYIFCSICLVAPLRDLLRNKKNSLTVLICIGYFLSVCLCGYFGFKTWNDRHCGIIFFIRIFAFGIIFYATNVLMQHRFVFKKLKILYHFLCRHVCSIFCCMNILALVIIMTRLKTDFEERIGETVKLVLLLTTGTIGVILVLNRLVGVLINRYKIHQSVRNRLIRKHCFCFCFSLVVTAVFSVLLLVSNAFSGGSVICIFFVFAWFYVLIRILLRGTLLQNAAERRILVWKTIFFLISLSGICGAYCYPLLAYRGEQKHEYAFSLAEDEENGVRFISCRKKTDSQEKVQSPKILHITERLRKMRDSKQGETAPY